MMKKLRNYFVGGLVVLTPLGVSAVLFIQLFHWVDGLSADVLRGLGGVGINIAWLEQPITGLGFLIVVTFVLMTGMLARNILGRQFLNLGERILSAIPLFNRIYGGLRQIIDVMAASQHGIFRRVVLIEYPRAGMYSLAFHTSEPPGEVVRATGCQELVNVFLPTTPNPTSGFFLIVPRKDVIELNMTVEDALKQIISAGAVNPDFVAAPPPAVPYAAVALSRETN